MRDKRKIRKIRTMAVGCALAATLVIGGTFAYFTDGDTATNEFSIGKGILVDLQEPGFVEDYGPDNGAINIIANQEIRKDPQVANEGTRDAYVFLSVKVPVMNVEAANADGSGVKKDLYQMFTYKLPDNSKWSLVTSGITGAVSVGSAATDTAKIQNATGSYGIYEAPAAQEGSVGYVQYLYAYTGSNAASMEPLAPHFVSKASDPSAYDENSPEVFTTQKLFNAVKVINLTENDSASNTGASFLEGLALEMPVTAYAIQADFLDSTSADQQIDGTNSENVSSPSAVWAVIQNQNGDVLYNLSDNFFKDDQHRAFEDSATDLPADTSTSGTYVH